jgi:transposase
LANWERICVFLGDVNVPIDNNESERALRPVAKGRENWLFAGHYDAAEQLMGLLGLCASCDANAINPEAYLTDVLARLDSHPASRLDELLPHRRQPGIASMYACTGASP